MVFKFYYFVVVGFECRTFNRMGNYVGILCTYNNFQIDFYG